MEIMGAEVSDVLRTFADQYKLNLVIAEDVSGKVNLKLKNVSILQAFLSILRAAKLAYIREGEILRIMSLDELAQENKLKENYISLETKIFRPEYASASRLAESMKKLLSKRDDAFIDADERTNSLVVKDIPEKLDEMEELFKLLDIEKVTLVRPTETEIIELQFIDSKEIGANLKSMLSDKGKIEINEKRNSIIVTDIPENTAIIKNLIEKLDKPSRQVHIEAKIVETTKNFSKALGVQWGGYYRGSPSSGKSFPTVYVEGSAKSIKSASTEDPGHKFAVNLPLPENVNPYGAFNLTLGHLKDKAFLDIQLSAMEEKGEGRILSTPSIVTLDNTEAIIETGARIPIQTYETSGGGDLETLTIEYVEAFTKLEVTPHITSDNRIKLKINADKDRPDFSETVAGNPLISRKGAKTELIVRDGETTVIGGLSITDATESQSKVPWFAEIPVIGNLFKNTHKRKTYDELLIFITPHIIEN